jgi:hypothetical protein
LLERTRPWPMPPCPPAIASRRISRS